MKTENATGDASRLYQAMLAHLQTGLWNDIRNARTLSWMVSGLLLSQRSTLPNWLSHINARATLAQRTERRVRRWLENPAIDPIKVYGPLITRALRDWGTHTLILALDTSVLFETFCLIRVSVLFRGRAVPLVSRVLEHSSAQVSTAHLLPVLAEVKGLLDALPIREVRLLADRGFCDTQLMAWLRVCAWHYRIRTVGDAAGAGEEAGSTVMRSVDRRNEQALLKVFVSCSPRLLGVFIGSPLTG
ncbi:hypothetical protein LAJ19_16225 (plasmid) [Deinococcus taeanensis]|uniref:hypothetical protein n=1 Tax=Deinococcus taeanensis TaxID=2737050 RepID=UPI001CDD8241|nr:hypothetical protein [Deinococcus taeanensis]UBV44706.1 hypothetical protein LAJ19_16225 [Deinococcus taeanensis]